MAAAAARGSPDVAPVDFFLGGKKNEGVAAAARESPDVAPVEVSLCAERRKKVKLISPALLARARASPPGRRTPGSSATRLGSGLD